MGSDINTIGRHLLNASSLESLAKEISDRFNLNIIYGYQDMFKLDDHFNLADTSCELVEIGSINKVEGNGHRWLIDHYYQHRQYVQDFGPEIIELAQYDKTGLQACVSETYYELLETSTNESMYVTNDMIEIDFYYLTRWWPFCALFRWPEDMGESFFQFRRDLKEIYLKAGVSEIVYYNDQGPLSGEKYYPEATWDNMQKALKKYEDKQVDIPTFIKNKERWGKDDYPIYFTDDFSDL
jgi:hypothetical protein